MRLWIIEGLIDLKIKTYSELSQLDTFDERFHYLIANGHVGDITFGGSRFLNQDFYRSAEWKRSRSLVIVRDSGCDLGIIDRPIRGKIIIHHLVPITKEDLLSRTKFLLDPEYLICVSHQTHNAIHYGSEESVPKDYVPRSPNDTCPWR